MTSATMCSYSIWSQLYHTFYVFSGKLFYSEEAKAWCIPNMASDRSVVMRSQRILYEKEKMRPAQFQVYFGMSRARAIMAMLFGIFFYVMTMFAFTRKLLLKVQRFLLLLLMLFAIVLSLLLLLWLLFPIVYLCFWSFILHIFLSCEIFLLFILFLTFFTFFFIVIETPPSVGILLTQRKFKHPSKFQ